MAPGTMRAATAAAEPDDDPPGVWAGFHGLRVGDGSRNANWVVWVLPRMTAPAARSRATAPQSRVGCVWANSRAPAVVGMPRHVEDILDADRHAVQRTSRAAGRGLGVALAGRRQGAVGVEMDPRQHLRLQRPHAGQASLDEGHGRADATADVIGGLAHSQFGQRLGRRHPAPRRRFRIELHAGGITLPQGGNEAAHDLVDPKATGIDGEVGVGVEGLAGPMQRLDLGSACGH